MYDCSNTYCYISCIKFGNSVQIHCICTCRSFLSTWVIRIDLLSLSVVFCPAWQFFVHMKTAHLPMKELRIAVFVWRLWPLKRDGSPAVPLYIRFSGLSKGPPLMTSNVVLWTYFTPINKGLINIIITI